MHDSRGAALKVGDRVLIEAEVVQLSTGGDENYCCVDVQVKTPDQPGGEKVMAAPKLSAMSTRMLTKIGAAILLALLMLMPTTVRADWTPNPDGSWTFGQSTPIVQPAKIPVVIQPGYHSHLMADGSTIVHADTNFGSPTAHAGVVGSNWPKTGLPGQTVLVSPDPQFGPPPALLAVADCPGGRCPVGVRSATSSYTVMATASVRTSRGLFGRLRERLANRPHLFGQRGCP